MCFRFLQCLEDIDDSDSSDSSSICDCPTTTRTLVNYEVKIGLRKNPLSLASLSAKTIAKKLSCLCVIEDLEIPKPCMDKIFDEYVDQQTRFPSSSNQWCMKETFPYFHNSHCCVHGRKFFIRNIIYDSSAIYISKSSGAPHSNVSNG